MVDMLPAISKCIRRCKQLASYPCIIQLWCIWVPPQCGVLDTSHVVCLCTTRVYSAALAQPKFEQYRSNTNADKAWVLEQQQLEDSPMKVASFQDSQHSMHKASTVLSLITLALAA